VLYNDLPSEVKARKKIKIQRGKILADLLATLTGDWGREADNIHNWIQFFANNLNQKNNKPLMRWAIIILLQTQTKDYINR
jgi:hypothetical protein